MNRHHSARPTSTVKPGPTNEKPNYQPNRPALVPSPNSPLPGAHHHETSDYNPSTMPAPLDGANLRLGTVDLDKVEAEPTPRAIAPDIHIS